MCGIAGIFSTDLNEQASVAAMVAAQHHRGPDADGFYQDGPFRGGMRRLSINDLHGGDQPLYSEDQSIVMLYNGEIYNSPSLRRDLEAAGVQFRTHSDGEVICHLFKKYGQSAFDMLDGMFAISLWDRAARVLYLVRDIPGEKPLYYTRTPSGGLAYASELRSFRAVQGLELSLNYQAIWDFPTYLWVPEPTTIYRDVFALERGKGLRFDGRVLETFDLKNPFAGKFSRQDVNVETVRDVVERSVQSRLLADVPVGCFLSSGLDSSIVTSIAQRELGNVTTFSIGFENVDDPYHGKADESAAAKEYADILGTTHHEIRVKGHDFRDALSGFCHFGDQPFAVSSGLGILFIAKAAREAGIKTLLSGDGADELFGGYSWYQHLDSPVLRGNIQSVDHPVSFQNFGLEVEKRLSIMAGFEPQKRAWAWHYYAAEEEKRALFNPDLFGDTVSSYRFFDGFKVGQWEAVDYVRQDREFYLPFEMMRKMDRMTMAHSVEGRAPFVAPEILALCDQFDYGDLVQGDVLKPLLRNAFDGVVPEHIRSRPKHGFNVPVDHWLKDDWNDLIAQICAPSSALVRLGMISPTGSRDIFEKMLWDKERLNGHTIFCFIMLNMWLEQQGF